MPKFSVAATIAVLAAALPAAAQAAAPSASTSSATSVTYQSAILRGSVNPNGASTSWYFQYGTTGAYGAQTTPVSAGSGHSSVSVSTPVAGLAANTTYHFRLVAVGAGATVGADRTFKTAKVPLSLAIAATPNPVTYGAPLQIEGTLSGTGNGGRSVALQQDPFPYVPLSPPGPAVFTQVGNPELTNADGTFIFTLASAPAVTTEYRVVTLGSNPQVVSSVVLARVALSVSASVRRSHARRGFLARFSGAVNPAQNGARVGIERLTGSGWKAVGGTLTRNGAYVRTLHLYGGGFYRVIVLPLDSGPLAPGYSQAVLVKRPR